MTSRWQQLRNLLTFHWHRLLLFELIWRLVGLTVVFPLINFLFLVSIRITNRTFLANYEVLDHLQRPSTLAIGLVMFLIFGLYVTFEVVALHVLFHEARFGRDLSGQTWMMVTIRRWIRAIKTHHIALIFSSMIFLLMVEGLHVVGIASTIQLPVSIDNELERLTWVLPVAVLVIVLLAFLFQQTLFFEGHATIRPHGIQADLIASHRQLRHRRLPLTIEFLLLNAGLNLVFYTLYLGVIGAVGLGTSVLHDGTIAFTTVLTLLYSIYLVVGLVASIVLVPVNVAWICVWYYVDQDDPDESLVADMADALSRHPLRRRRFRQLVAVLQVVLLLTTILVLSVSRIRASSAIVFLQHPVIVAHRGGGLHAPENTLAAIERGIEMGADAIEFDVRFTRDGTPVLFHDSTTARTTDDPHYRRLDQMTLLQVTNLDAGSWYDPAYAGEGVPTLAAALDTLDRRADLLLELKQGNPEQIAVILALLEDTNMIEKTTLLAFNEDWLKTAKAQQPQIRTMLLLRYVIGDIDALIAADHIDALGIHHDIALRQRSFLTSYRGQGKQVYVWTVNDTETIATLDRIGVDGIITSEPVVARNILYGDTTRTLYRELLERLFVRNE